MCQGLGPTKHDEISEIDRTLCPGITSWSLFLAGNTLPRNGAINSTSTIQLIVIVAILSIVLVALLLIVLVAILSIVLVAILLIVVLVAIVATCLGRLDSPGNLRTGKCTGLAVGKCHRNLEL